MSSPRNDQQAKWRKFVQNITEKRTRKPVNAPGKQKVNNASSSITNKKEITVQLLANEATGKAQKFERRGPQQFVAFPFENVTISNIVDACNMHFKGQLIGMTCDVLAGERGPSCSRVDQLPNLKVIHVRFLPLEKHSAFPLGLCDDIIDSGGSQGDRSSIASLECSMSARIGPAKSLALVPRKRKADNSLKISCPKSLSVTQMLKLGKAISKTAQPRTTIAISQFDLENMAWSSSTLVNFEIQEKELGRGAFRCAFKGICKSPPYKDKEFVVKYYLPDTIDMISQVNDTVEGHARKSIQMHTLAKNFADQIIVELKKAGKEKEFGQPFRFVEAFLGIINSTNESVTVEEFTEGQFVKYINNNGSIVNVPQSELQEKAECLVHFSYNKSLEKLMVVDIQGSGYNLTDPEIATTVGSFDEKDELLFCVGNLSTTACDTFFAGHSCNTFCDLLDLCK